MNILETAEALIAPVFKAPNHSCFVCGITFHGAAIFRTQLDSNCEKVVMIETKRENQWLVGGLNPSEKYESFGMIIPKIWENKIDVPNHQPDEDHISGTNT